MSDDATFTPQDVNMNSEMGAWNNAPSGSADFDAAKLMMEPRSLLVEAIIKGSAPLRQERLMAMAYLALSTPGLYKQLQPFDKFRLEQNVGAIRALRDALKSLSIAVEEFLYGQCARTNQS